jgi:hypothetical protein
MRLRLVATPAITALADHAKAVNQASWHRDGCTAPRHNRVFAAATGLAPGTAAATPPIPTGIPAPTGQPSVPAIPTSYRPCHRD